MTLSVRRTGSTEYGRWMKILLVGSSGSGKTRFSSSFPNPLYASAEGGLMSIADRGIPYVDIKSSSDLFAVKAICDQDPDVRQKMLGFPVDTVVIDTIDEIQRILIRERIEETKKESMTLPDWGWLGEQMTAIIRGFRNVEMNTIFTCFAGETAVVTLNGIIPIEKLTGTTVDVLADDGEWRPAAFSQYGEQELFDVVVGSGEVISATANHRWSAVWGAGQKEKEVTTLELKGRYIKFNLPSKPDRNEDFNEGIAHGIVFGDGSKHDNWKSHTYVHLMGADKGTLVRFLEPYVETSIRYHPDGAVSQKDGSRFEYTYVGGLPPTWKDLPSDDASRSYWYGFILGLITTDGNVGKNVYICNDDVEILRRLAIKAGWVGFHSRSIKKVRENSPYTGLSAPCYRLNFSLFSVNEDEMLRPKHVRLFVPSKNKRKFTRVKNVLPTGRFENVYCCVEPVTHSFTVGSGIPTGNCHVKEISDGESGRMWFEPGMQGAIGKQIPGYVDLALLLRTSLMTVVEDGQAVRKLVRALVSQPDLQHDWVKDRSGRLPVDFQVDFESDYKRLWDAVYGGLDLPERPLSVIEEPSDVDDSQIIKGQVTAVEDAGGEVASREGSFQESVPDVGTLSSIPDDLEEGSLEIPQEAPRDVVSSDISPTKVEEEVSSLSGSAGSGTAVLTKVEEGGLEENQKTQSAIPAPTKVDTPFDSTSEAVCDECGELITKDQADLSKIRYRKLLCRVHFSEMKKK